MARYTLEFNVERNVNGEIVEYNLEAECEVEPFIPGRFHGPPEKCYPDEGGRAYIDGSIMVVDEDGNREPWDGALTKAELNNAEERAYCYWSEESAGEDPDVDDDVVDYDYLDRYDPFHDDRSVAVGGKKMYF